MSIESIMRQIAREELEKLLHQQSSATEYLTTRQVAELTGLSIPFFEARRSADSPDQPPYQRVGRSIRYRRSDVEAWMASRTRGAK